MKPQSTVAAVIAQDLAGYGARRCFGLLGTANFKISHALVEAGVELISARHEGNAATMADAYAKSTGELTLCSVHSGLGLTLSNSPVKLPPAASRMHPDPAAVRRLVDVILQSKRPLVLGGRGAVVLATSALPSRGNVGANPLTPIGRQAPAMPTIKVAELLG